MRRRLWLAVVCGLGAGTFALALQAGGYYPGVTAVAAVVALVVLAVWMLAGPAIGATFGATAWMGATPLAAFAVWVLVSGSWSHAPARSLLAFDHVLLYLIVLVLFSLVGETGIRARVLVSVMAASMVLVVLVALAAWLTPDLLPISHVFERRRLSFPTGYWNTTGLLAAFGAVWSLHLASASRESPLLRVAGASAIVPCVAVIGWTGSRGAAVAAIAGLLVYAATTRSRALVIGLIAAAPAVAGAVILTGQGDILTTRLLLPVVVARGHRLAFLLLACMAAVAVLRAALLTVERRVQDVTIAQPARRTRMILVAGALVIAMVGVVGTNLPAHLSTAVHQFSAPPSGAVSGPGRFTNLSGDGRGEIWRVALRFGFEPHPLTGSGAGTFGILWAQHRSSSAYIPNAQSLYVGVLSELGIVGAALLACTLIAIVVALRRRARPRGAGGQAWAALLAGAAAWLIFALVDWNWEMPACTLWLFAAGGLALSRDAPLSAAPAVSGAAVATRRRWAARAARAAAAVITLAVAVVPLALERSDRHLTSALRALQGNDCPAASREARASRATVTQRPEPDMVLAVCAQRLGRHARAVADATAAIHVDPSGWEPHYILGLVQAAAGDRPSSLGVAQAENRRDPFVIEATVALIGRRRSALRRAALRLPVPLATDWCGGPTQADQIAACGDPRLPLLGGGVGVFSQMSAAR